MIYIIIEYIIDYFVLIQTPFQVFESTTVCVIRKYKFDDIACSDVLFSCIDITTSSWELAGDWNRTGDNSKTSSLHLQRRIEWIEETSLHTF